jgi:hypothetical protein
MPRDPAQSRPLLGCAFFLLIVVVLVVIGVLYVLWWYFVGPDFPN